MSTPASGHGPEFALPQDLYRLQDMERLVSHPDLRADSVETHEVPTILPHIVALGHVAITVGDTEAYDAWLTHTTHFVDTVHSRLRSDVAAPRYNQSVAELRFYGAVHGRADVADKLHEQLATEEDTASLLGIVQLCAENDVNPRVWIEHHSPTADDRAKAWAKYFSTKKINAQARGIDITTKDLQVPGSEQLIADVLRDALTNRGVLYYAQTAYELASDVRTKELIIGGYDLALNERFDQEEQTSTPRDQEAVYEFACAVIHDPAVTQDVKAYLYNQVATLVGGWSYIDFITGRARLEVARTIAFGEDMVAALQTIDGKFQKYSNRNETLRNRLMQSTTLATAEMYAEQGMFAEAAKHVSNLTRLTDWYKGVMHYVRKGGDIELVRRTDGERLAFENLVSGLRNGTETDDSQWDVRVLVADYLQFEQQSDTHEMRATLLALADEIGSDTMRRDDGGVSSVILRTLTARLLAKDPAAIEIGPQMVEQLRQEDYSKYLYRLFARHGSAAMTAAGWQHVNRPRQPHEPPEALSYLRDYVGMLLASRGISSSL